MPLIAKDKGDANYDPVPAGVHQAVCYGVVDLGTQPQTNPQFRAAQKVILMFELPHERLQFKKEGVDYDLPRAISTTQLTFSLSSKANLRKLLESWRGKPFTAEELEGFDMENLIGVNSQVNVVHVTSKTNGKTYANIATIIPLAKGMVKAKLENPSLYFVLDDFLKTGPVLEWPKNLPDWLKSKILLSAEYQAAQSGNGEPPPPADESGPDHAPFIDEDVPF